MMMPQHHDNVYLKRPSDALLCQRDHGRYYAEVPALALDEQSRLVDQVIRFAFETLGVRHLEVHVAGTEMASLAARSSAHGRGSVR